MNKLLSILLIFSLAFTQSLEVEGDLTVTGSIESQTIDSLLQVIQDLQSQLSALQGGNRLETRTYQFEIDFTSGNVYYPIDMLEITGYDLPYAIFQIIGLDDYTFFDQVQIDYDCDNMNVSGNSMFDYYNGELTFYSENIYLDNQNCKFIRQVSNDTFNRNLILAITASFPQESNLQQRKPGLQSNTKATD